MSAKRRLTNVTPMQNALIQFLAMNVLVYLAMKAMDTPVQVSPDVKIN